MQILADSEEPLGARVIASRLKDRGFELGERAVRYHLKILDERGLTYLVGQRDGRALTDKGITEADSALVNDKVGFAISRVENLAFRTTLDPLTGEGDVPVNISFFDRHDFSRSLRAMRPAFDAGLCASDMVAIGTEGQKLGDITVPEGKIGLATVCSIVYNGVMLKAGIPMDSKYGGILEYRDGKARRFTELIDYTGCSLDPSTIFIRARMTSVRNVVSSGNGLVLANYREIPSICVHTAAGLIEHLGQLGFKGVVVIGQSNEPVCEMPLNMNKAGLVLFGGLNPVALAEETGTSSENKAGSTVMNFRDMMAFREAAIEFRDLVKFWKSHA